jgi:hypothetical protein
MSRMLIRNRPGKLESGLDLLLVVS